MMKKLIETEQIKILLTALECSQDGIHILDSDGNTLYINDACTRIEGVDKEEIHRKNVIELVEDGIYSESATLKVLEEKKQITIMQTAKNGKQILVTGTPIYKAKKIDKVIINSRDITELRHLQQEIELLKKEKFGDISIVSESKQMKKVLNIADTVAFVDSTILIMGESGTGKDLFAKHIHSRSSRKNNAFIKIDCSSIPEALFESELFGYEKGAFTGANTAGKLGLLELANNGTVFLDEIGEMPLAMQTKLLRVIQDKQIVSVGGTRQKNIDLRIIAATNANIEEMINIGTFRKDLYYRLNIVPLYIPPLRERKEDILPLIQRNIRKINKKYNWDKNISPKTLNELLEYDWPGNVREVENLIERLLVSSEKEQIDEALVVANKDKLYGKNQLFDLTKPYRQILEEFDYNIINKTIEEEGSIPLAAKFLDIDVTTLRRKLKKYEENKCKNAL